MEWANEYRQKKKSINPNLETHPVVVAFHNVDCIQHTVRFERYLLYRDIYLEMPGGYSHEQGKTALSARLVRLLEDDTVQSWLTNAESTQTNAWRDNRRAPAHHIEPAVLISAKCAVYSRVSD